MKEFDPVEEVIEAVRGGKIVVVMDDEDRENEGDLICSGQMVTPDIINFMAQEARGLICLAISHEIAEKLGVEVLGKMPIDPKLAEIVEQEKFYEADNQYLKNIIDKFN